MTCPIFFENIDSSIMLFFIIKISSKNDGEFVCFVFVGVILGDAD